MSLSGSQITALKALEKPMIAEYLTVYWSDAVTGHYAVSKFDELPGYNGVTGFLDGGSIEVRLANDGLYDFELCADIRSVSEIPFVFENADDAIGTLFRTHGDAAKCELHRYYPEIAGDEIVWWGVLRRPRETRRATLSARATNGFFSGEGMIPHRMRPEECSAIFGGLLTDIDEYRGNGCPYNRQVGGSTGNLNSGSPYTSCDKSEAACVARLGQHGNGEPLYHQGFPIDLSPITSDTRAPGMAKTVGNTTRAKDPIRVIAGSKYVAGNTNLYFRKELNPSDPERGWVSGVWDVCEGPVEVLDEIHVNDKRIEPMHLNVRKGELAQSPTSYSPDSPGFSGTACFFARYGWVNAATTELSSLATRCRVHGYNKVRIYTDAKTYTEDWTNNRAWWLLEFYTNLRFALKYEHSRFDIEAFIAAADWFEEYVRFTDPFGNNYDHYRSFFDAVVEPRRAADVVTDICRSGRISVPFQWNGVYTISTLAAATSGELAAAPVFSDKGTARNIVWEENAQSLTIEQTPDDELVNRITLTYEDAAKLDRERPLTVRDEAQELKAGKILGQSGIKSIVKNFAAFGCRVRKEVIKLGFALLNLGEFDEGGIQNNLRVRFQTPWVQTRGIKKYQIVKVESDLLADYDFEYFRILSMRSRGGAVEVVAQAYNHDWYTNDFEVLASTLPSPPTPPGLPSPDTTPNPVPCNPAFGTLSVTDGILSVPIDPC